MPNQYNRFFKLVVLTLLALVISACASTSVRKEGTQSVAATEASLNVRDSFKVAISLMEEEKYTEAKDLLEKLNQQNNRLAGVHANLGIAYGKLGEYEKAKASLEEAIGLNPESSDIANEMALAYRNSGDYAAARGVYEKMLEKNPKNEKSHLNLGILCDIYMNDVECALKHYKEYEALYAVVPDPKNKKKVVVLPKTAKNEKVVHWIKDIEKRK